MRSAAAFIWIVVAGCCAPQVMAADIAHLQGEMAGEVTANSVILQSRLTAPAKAANGDVPGAAGVARFEIADNAEFRGSRFTPWIEAKPESDHILKAKVTGLNPGTRYRYRLQFGTDRDHTTLGPPRTFKTLPGKAVAAPIRVVVVTGMNYAFFHDGQGRDPRKAYSGEDKHLGYPALATILKMQPDFFVGTGDNVYYDHHADSSATDAASMRHKWHQQFVQPRFVELFAKVPTYWEKDDHDHRYNDCDLTGNRPPSSDLGIAIFKEQVPITDPADPDAVTYRTHRISKDLQIWLPENRDYRSPNRSPNDANKTIWGEKQKQWLMRTLKESDATFKIIISPTPMIGPDDASKRDNHVNPGGFSRERDAFFEWAKAEGLLERGLYLVCGDRHWQYHSIDPRGFEEFSCGALVDANARLGRAPGDPKSTDPGATIRQPFVSPEATGGFLEVVITPAGDGKPSTAGFNFYDERGERLYQALKSGK